MNLKKTALVLIGFQNDYFAPDGILHSVIEESSRVSGVLENTLALLEQAGAQFDLVISTPINFSRNYKELKAPVGILKTIKELGAFQSGSRGAQTIAQFERYKALITEVPGKRGLDAFSNTGLEALLRQHDIEHIVLAGTVTSICVDSTGRRASELGLGVTVLSDCTSGRTTFEQQFYCENVFPLYAQVQTAAQLLDTPLASDPSQTRGHLNHCAERQA